MTQLKTTIHANTHSQSYTHAHTQSPNTSSYADEVKGKAGVKRIVKATGYSLQGLTAAYKNEAAFRQVIALNLLLFVAVSFMPLELAIKMILILASFVSLIVELFNTAIEACVDHTSTQKHPLAKIAKDVGSAAQLLSLILLAVLWAVALLLP